MFNKTIKKKPLGNFGGGVAINKDEVDAQNGWGDRTDLTRGEQSKALSPLEILAQKKANADSAVEDHGKFTYNYQDQLNDVMTKILGREKFKYDLNGDALYNQYKDKFIHQGQMAMMDTMGQAQAMTGGYGNSYAQSVGQQAYQAQLQNLNDIVPELYQIARDRYDAEGTDLLNKYGLLTDDYKRKYGEHIDEYNKLLTERDYANNEYANEYNKLSPSVTEDTSIKDITEIQKWRDEVLGAKTEDEVKSTLEMLMDIDPNLAFRLYEQWMKKHEDEVKAGGNALYNGLMGGLGILTGK